ncbi:MAG: tRNA (adenine-N1)-methyltransferase [Deltaproteobacteria bacterium]|nr:MAG: tRNA (adenine-N1)-methyltransferase [Deltaproteobacteria bacterium]
MRGPFREGEDVLLVDGRGKEYLVTLEKGKSYSTHRGTINLDDVIGKEEGVLLTSTKGERFIAFRPTFNQFVLNLKRSAQIIYPKDIGPILLWADIFPGAFVVEGGAGWGALTIALLRAIGEKGKLVTYEVRDDFAEASRRNIARFLGEVPNHTIRMKDIYEGIEERDVDRVVLDVPEPWKAVWTAREALRPGGILLAYLPTIIQVQEYCETVRREGGFTEPEVFEVIHRPWNVKGQSVRPVSWMFSHSAFIISTRKFGKG